MWNEIKEIRSDPWGTPFQEQMKEGLKRKLRMNDDEGRRRPEFTAPSQPYVGYWLFGLFVKPLPEHFSIFWLPEDEGCQA